MLAGVATGVDVVVEAETDAGVELGVRVGISKAEPAVCGEGLEVRMGGGAGLFITCHFTRSRVATESSKDE